MFIAIFEVQLDRIMKRESEIINHLQKRVIKHFGKQISTATDCEKLADALKQNFNANISPQTLRRFFGLIKSTSKTSIFTLDLLSKKKKKKN